MRHDFRPPRTQTAAAAREGSTRVVTWNIERGYCLEALIQELHGLDADILLLQARALSMRTHARAYRPAIAHVLRVPGLSQEIDIGCERSGGVDTGVAIARAHQPPPLTPPPDKTQYMR